MEWLLGHTLRGNHLQVDNYKGVSFCISGEVKLKKLDLSTELIGNKYINEGECFVRVSKNQETDESRRPHSWLFAIPSKMPHFLVNHLWQC